MADLPRVPRAHVPWRRVTALLIASVASVTMVAPAHGSKARGPLPFALPDEADALAADRTGAAIFVVRTDEPRGWSRLTARAGSGRSRPQLLLGDRSAASLAVSSDLGLFAADYTPRDAEGRAVRSEVQAIPFSLRGPAETPTTVSSPGAYASDATTPSLGPSGAAAVLFREGPDAGRQSPVLAFKPAGNRPWLQPISLPAMERAARYVLFSERGDAVLLTYPTDLDGPDPSAQRITADGALGPPIDLGFDELGLRVQEGIDFTAAFTSDGALHAAISVYADIEHPEDPSWLVMSRVPAGIDRAEATVVGPSADPLADNVSLHLAPGPNGDIALVASEPSRGDLRIFESKGGARPRLTARIHASTDLAQGATLLRAPSGGLNLVWNSNADRARGYAGLMGAHRGVKHRRFSKPKPLSRSVLTRGSVYLDEAVQLTDGNVGIAYTGSGGPDFQTYGLLARP